MLAIFQSVGNNPVLNDLLKNAHKRVDNSCAHSFNMRGGIRSGLGTCEHLVFSGIFFRSLVVQKVLLNLSFIMLPNSGRLLCCCVNTDENYNFIS